MTLAHLPSLPPARQPAAPLLEACYAWVTMPTGDSGFITLRQWGVTLQPDYRTALTYEDPSGAVRSFTLFRSQWVRTRAGASLRVVGASEAERATRVALAADALVTALCGAPSEEMTDNFIGRANIRNGFFGGRGSVTTPTKSNGLDCGQHSASRPVGRT